MKILIVLIAPLALAQSGADIFAKTCGSGYCHGMNGSGGGAPKLANRGFDEAYIRSVIRSGVPGTAMQGYGQSLTRPEFAAVVAYIARLNGIDGNAEPVKLSPEAAEGRALFAKCSTCHHVDGVGIDVAAIAKVPADLTKLRVKDVRSIAIGADEFPGLVVSQGGRRVSVWDLSVVPPVLRSADASAVRIGGAAAWTHPSGYGPAELAKIAAFLRAVVPD